VSFIFRVLGVLLLSFGLSGQAWAVTVTAAELLDAKLDYVADYYLTTGSGRFQGTVIHGPGHERREFDAAAGHQILLLRRDIDEAAVLWSQRKLYVSTSFQALAALIGGFDGVLLDRQAVGHERIGNEKTTRYQIRPMGKGPGGFSGQIWMTSDGILMKADGEASLNGHPVKLVTGLLNLQRIKADPSAFVRPSDYIGLPLDLSKLGLSYQ